jgi:hypothetical protein
MAYLKNSAVNLLNLHYGLHALAQNGAGVFFAVFLLKAGVPVSAVFAAIALVLAGRFLFRPLVLVLAPRVGLRALVVKSRPLRPLTMRKHVIDYSREFIFRVGSRLDAKDAPSIPILRNEIGALQDFRDVVNIAGEFTVRVF